MEIKEMDLEQVETRLAEVKDMLHEDGADLEALETEIRSLKDRKQEIHAEIEARKAEVKEVMETAKEVRTFEEERTFKKMDEKEVRNSEEYINAYVEYLKTGKIDRVDPSTSQFALKSENAINGAVPVPTIVDDIIRTAWEKDGIMALVKKAFIKGNYKVGFEMSATPAAIHTEGTPANAEETLNIGTVELIAQSVKKYLFVTDEVMDLKGRAFLDYLYDEISYQIAKKSAEILIGAIESASTRSSNTAVAVGEIEVSAYAMDTIAQAIAKLSDEARNPVIVMNKQTWADFKAIQYANGYGVDPFENLPVVFCNYLPTLADASASDTVVIVGDFGYGALANFPNGQEITLKFDDLSLAEKDLVKIVGRQYVGLGLVAPNAFTRIVKADQQG